MPTFRRSGAVTIAVWLGIVLGVLSLLERGSESGCAEEYTLPSDADIDEPRAERFSPALATRYLDETASAWAETRRCVACHTIPAFLMARPLLRGSTPEADEVRAFVERVVVERLEAEPMLPVDGISAVGVQTAVALAIHDRLTTGKLHPVTRTALDRMWTRQRDDGSWEWPFRDVPPIKIDEHYGVTLALVGAGMAPDRYSATEAAQSGIAKARHYLATHPPTSLHHEGMLAWAAAGIDGLMTADERRAVAGRLLATQRPDGGWSLASLVETTGADGNENPKRIELRAKPGHGTEFLTFVGRTGVYESSLDSDGYATGFVIFIARQTGVPADDPRLARGIAWLKQNQRESGRWFTPSQGNHGRNYISNAGTAYAVMALKACGELE